MRSSESKRGAGAGPCTRPHPSLRAPAWTQRRPFSVSGDASGALRCRVTDVQSSTSRGAAQARSTLPGSLSPVARVTRSPFAPRALTPPLLPRRTYTQWESLLDTGEPPGWPSGAWTCRTAGDVRAANRDLLRVYCARGTGSDWEADRRFMQHLTQTQAVLCQFPLLLLKGCDGVLCS